MDDAIKKLQPGTVDLTIVSRETGIMAKARESLHRATTNRSDAIRAAHESGAELEEIAKAAGVTVVRIRQILQVKS